MPALTMPSITSRFDKERLSATGDGQRHLCRRAADSSAPENARRSLVPDARVD